MIFFFFFCPDLSILGKFAAGRKKGRTKREAQLRFENAFMWPEVLTLPTKLPFLTRASKFCCLPHSWCLRMALNVEFGVALMQKLNIHSGSQWIFKLFHKNLCCVCWPGGEGWAAADAFAEV